jgi:2'-5' RNA ligase
LPEQSVIRAFIGVKIDSPVLQNIAAAVAELTPCLAGIRWIPPENLHFTLKFLAEIDEKLVEPIAITLEQSLCPFPRFTINAKGLGVFPNLRRVQVLWAGLEGVDLGNLTSQIETTLEPLGFARETRAFKPHLTLGRWRRFESSSKALRRELEKWQNVSFGRSTVSEVILFQSLLGPSGASYRPVKIFPLNDGSR